MLDCSRKMTKLLQTSPRVIDGFLHFLECLHLLELYFNLTDLQAMLTLFPKFFLASLLSLWYFSNYFIILESASRKTFRISQSNQQFWAFFESFFPKDNSVLITDWSTTVIGSIIEQCWRSIVCISWSGGGCSETPSGALEVYWVFKILIKCLFWSGTLPLSIMKH